MYRDSADRVIASVPLAKIHVGERLRALCEEAIGSLVESIKTIGLQTPISVQTDPSSRAERYLLVAGLHRLEACRRLGMAHVDARIIDLDEIERRLWEVAENLHRAELTALERSEHIEQWIGLAEQRRKATEVSAQIAPKLSQKGVGQGVGGGRPESGINAAARVLNIGRAEAQRSIKVAGLTSEAKAEARSLGLDDNQSVLLKAAKAPSKEAQIRALHEQALRKTAGRDDPSASDARIGAAMSAVRRLSQDELATFVDWFSSFRAGRGERAPAETNANSAQPRWSTRI